MTRLSVFDLDRTLTERPTYSAFLVFAAWSLAPWRIVLIPTLMPIAILFALGVIKRRGMKEAMQFVLLGNKVPRASIERVARAYAVRLARAGVYAQGVAQIAIERAAGRRVVMATAAPLFYAAPVAQILGIEDVVATGSVWKDEALTARIAGENCYGAAKLRMLRDYLLRAGLERNSTHIRFFSDHASDQPTFCWSDEAVSVNPSRDLHTIAQSNGWKILDWRARPAVKQRWIAVGAAEGRSL